MTWDHGFAALMPCAGLCVAKDLDARLDDELGWTSLLADVVHSDRDETVGGMRHARPVVAAR
jgi:hypothetical protein